MPVNSVAENVFGTLGAVCWTIQLIPQIWKSWRTKSTKGLSPWLVLFWSIAGVFLGVYVVVQRLNIPLVLQPQLFSTLSLVSWCQCGYYTGRRSALMSVVLCISLAIVFGGFEAGMVFAVRSASGTSAYEPALRFFGILSSVIISTALLPQYYEIYRLKEVVGISVPFMIIDLLGGVFSDLSLIFKADFDIIAAITYSVVVVMDGAVILAALILNGPARRRRLAAMSPLPPTDGPSGTEGEIQMRIRLETTDSLELGLERS